jgi:hypothetical protein
MKLEHMPHEQLLQRMERLAHDDPHRWFDVLVAVYGTSAGEAHNMLQRDFHNRHVSDSANRRLNEVSRRYNGLLG